MKMEVLNQGFDHVEFVVNDIDHHAKMYTRLGFEKVGETVLERRGLKRVVYAQGLIRILLTQSISEKSKNEKAINFLNKHQDGVTVLAVEVNNARLAFEEKVKAGARPCLEPVEYQSDFGSVVRSEIWTPEDLRYAFIERKHSGDLKQKALFDENLIVDRLQSPSPLGFQVVDHLTNNVNMGEMKKWVDWYKNIFDFKIIRHFDINTGRTGLISDAVQSQDGKLTVPVNEATEPESQVQEFVDRFNGAGVQHLALLTDDIIKTVGELKSRGFEFLSVPSTYYEMVPKRVPRFDEDLKELEKLDILLDSEGAGYLLQIFTGEMVGPFFFEFIQRKGNNGFGEGNFKALFEAIERDQIKRGVLKTG